MLDVEHDRHVRFEEPGRGGHVAGLFDTQLDDGISMPGACFQYGFFEPLEAPQVCVAGRLHDGVVLREDIGQEFLGGGFADAAGDGDKSGVE